MNNKIIIINGPNLNLLGEREQSQYGSISFDELKEAKLKLDSINHDYLPLCHGNALSFYFNDPENNGLEIFFDTPWDIDQPQAVAWDPELDETSALKWVEKTFKNEPSFVKREESNKEFVNRK